MIGLICAFIIGFSSPEIEIESTVEESVITVENENELFEEPIVLRSVNANNLDGGTFLVCDTTELGSIKIYIDKEYKKDWGLDGSKPVLLHSSSITGYYMNSNNLIRITINPYSDVWQYRNTTSSGYQTYDLHVLDYDSDDSNIQIDGKYAEHTYLIICVILLAIIALFIMR